MAYLAINGYELPPCKRGVKVIVTTVVDSGRDANGAVVGQRVGRDQYKIDGLEWPWAYSRSMGENTQHTQQFLRLCDFQRPGYEQSKDCENVLRRPYRRTLLGYS